MGAITVDIGVLVHARVAIQNAVEAGALGGFFRAPRTEDLSAVFQSAAATLAGGTRLIALP